MSAKLKSEDLVYVEEIYEKLLDCLEELPEELRESNSFGAWATTALSNILCKLMKGIGIPKEKFLISIGNMWDEQDKLPKKVLN